MGIGYLLGCLISILFWKFDRNKLWRGLHNKIRTTIHNKYIVEMIYIIIIMASIFIVSIFKYNEIANTIVSFLIIELSFVEKKVTRRSVNVKKKFYNTLSLISNSFIGGFLAPIVFIILFGNVGGIIYFLIYHISKVDDKIVYKKIIKTFNAIPTFLGSGILYIIYTIRNKTLKINFKGDFINNLINNPLLNIYILAAYIESVNFYYIEDRGVHYIKSYGVYQGKIDEICVKDYLSIIYGICVVVYLEFWLYMTKVGAVIYLFRN